MTASEHGPELELRQQPGDDPYWQDSAFLVWYDRDRGVGGILRIGHEPNREGGRVVLWFGLAAKGGKRYRRNYLGALEEGDLLSDGFGALDGRYRVTYDGAVQYDVDDEDCSISLTADDFHPRTDLFPESSGKLSDEFAPVHFESAGRISGVVELGGMRHEIDGLYQRDRSFGIRRWDTLLNHRWMPGSFGSERSFGSVAWHATDGSIRRYGYVADGQSISRADDVDIVVALAPDGTTHRGGRLEMTRENRRLLAVDGRPVAEWLFHHEGTAVVESICEIESDGRRGFCALEVSTNPRAGSAPVTTALHATTAEGLTQEE